MFQQGTRDDERAELSMGQKWGMTQAEGDVSWAGQAVLVGDPGTPRAEPQGSTKTVTINNSGTEQCL